jgi:hypothetical protein
MPSSNFRWRFAAAARRFGDRPLPRRVSWWFAQAKAESLREALRTTDPRPFHDGPASVPGAC